MQGGINYREKRALKIQQLLIFIATIFDVDDELNIFQYLFRFV